MYHVFKFGGASVKDAASVKNVCKISASFCEYPLIIIISAMGKMTNAFENLLAAFFKSEKGTELDLRLKTIIDFHLTITKELFPENHPVFFELESVFNEIQLLLQGTPSQNYDYEYDKIVSYGELLSTLIVSAYMNQQGLSNRWLDARELIHTDSQYREANILWEQTQKSLVTTLTNATQNIFIIQGFIGANSERLPTTLGREGSDYSAAAIAWCVDAPLLTIWKDVAGVFNADPKKFPEALLHPELSYFDALELAYYGAQVLHPKTIKPLENKKIPLCVRSFIEPNRPGTVITSDYKKLNIPSFITKENQVLYTLSSKDYSFITESNLKDIFSHITDHRLRINLMQSSALTFSFCTDYDERRHSRLLDSLSDLFTLHFNTGLTILTVRHYTEEVITSMTTGKEILLVEKSRNNAQILFSR